MPIPMQIKIPILSKFLSQISILIPIPTAWKKFGVPIPIPIPIPCNFFWTFS
jgi:hypothetical protein